MSERIIAYQKLKDWCHKKGLFLYEEDFNDNYKELRNRNYVFKRISDEFEFRIHANIINRYSGIYSIKKEIKEGFSEFYPVNDELFYMGFIKSSLCKAFKIEE